MADEQFEEGQAQDAEAEALAEAEAQVQAQAQAEAEAQAQAQAAKAGAALLKDRYEFHPDKPLLHLSTPSAQAFKVTDRRGPDRRLFGLVCDPELPVRVSVMRTLRGQQHVAYLTLVEWGVIDWSLFGRRTMGVVYQQPLGGRITDGLRTRKKAIGEQEMIRGVITPLVEGIRDLTQRGVTHRAIRPTNMFYMDEEQTKIVFGDCVTTPPAYDQPNACETIESCMCVPEGRGGGNFTNDLYSLGVALLTIYTGRQLLTGMSEEEVLDGKISLGSYGLLVRDIRLPLPLIEIMRGLLCDDPEERWTLDALDLWLGGRRLSPLQPKPEPRAKRTFSFMEKEYSTCRELARAFRRNWEEAVVTVDEGRLETWLHRAFEAHEMADAVELGRKVAAGMTKDIKAVKDLTLARTLMVLDTRAPIRYKDLSFLPDGIGPVLALAMVKKGDARLISEIMQREVPKLWFDTRDKYDPENSQMESHFRDLKNYLRHTAMGYGLERCLYESNELLPCQSPLVAGRYVSEIGELLPALDAVSKQVDPKAWPVDRHITAYVSARFNQSLEVHMVSLNNPDPEVSVLGMLGILAMIQWRLGPESLFNLSVWVGGLMGPVIGSFHSRERRRDMEKEVPRVVRNGNLAELYNVLDNAEQRADDLEEFALAKAEYAENQDEISYLESGAVGRDEQAEQTGHQTAAVTSVILGLVAVALMAAMRMF